MTTSRIDGRMKPTTLPAQKVWEWCTDAYLRHGRRLTLPAQTRPEKTYQWRYVQVLAKRFQEWDFDEATAQRCIALAVQHARQAGVLHKGLAALVQGNLLAICHQRLQTDFDISQSALVSLQHMRSWFVRQIGAQDELRVLLARAGWGQPANLVAWFQASRLSPLFLALSRSCTAAMDRLDPDERALLPKAASLYLLRRDFLADADIRRRARELFATDWRTSRVEPHAHHAP